MQRLPVCATSRTACLLVPYKLPENSAVSMKPPFLRRSVNCVVLTKWYSLASHSPTLGERVVSGGGHETDEGR
jgi:hypothetical protein